MAYKKQPVLAHEQCSWLLNEYKRKTGPKGWTHGQRDCSATQGQELPFLNARDAQLKPWWSCTLHPLVFAFLFLQPQTSSAQIPKHILGKAFRASCSSGSLSLRAKVPNEPIQWPLWPLYHFPKSLYVINFTIKAVSLLQVLSFRPQ